MKLWLTVFATLLIHVSRTQLIDSKIRSIDIIIAFGFLTCPQFSSKLPGTESIERNVDTIIEKRTLQFVQLLWVKEVELCKTVHYCHLNFFKVVNSRFLWGLWSASCSLGSVLNYSKQEHVLSSIIWFLKLLPAKYLLLRFVLI